VLKSQLPPFFIINNTEHGEVLDFYIYNIHPSKSKTGLVSSLRCSVTPFDVRLLDVERGWLGKLVPAIHIASHRASNMQTVRHLFAPFGCPRSPSADDFTSISCLAVPVLVQKYRFFSLAYISSDDIRNRLVSLNPTYHPPDVSFLYAVMPYLSYVTIGSWYRTVIYAITSRYLVLAPLCETSPPKLGGNERSELKATIEKMTAKIGEVRARRLITELATIFDLRIDWRGGFIYLPPPYDDIRVDIYHSIVQMKSKNGDWYSVCVNVPSGTNLPLSDKALIKAINVLFRRKEIYTVSVDDK